MSLIANGAGESGASNFYNGVVTTSTRFDHGSSAYLSFTPSSTGDRKVWTWSGWIKRTSLSSGEHYIYSSWDGSGNGYNAFYFSGDKLATYFDPNNNYGTISDRMFRDVSSWFHIVHQVDAANTSQKVWVNGVEQTLSSGRNPANNNYQTNTSGRPMIIGKHAWGTSSYNNMQLAEVNYMDGQKYQASDFGETKNGVWIAKEPSGITYGTNGYRLQFNQTGVGTASTSTVGADTSGNTNHFTSSGIVASDCAMPDCPENNFCTLNYNRTGQVANLKNGALTYKDSATGGPRASVGTFGATSGKWYFEVRLDNDLYSTMCGFMDVSQYAGSHLATDTAKGTGYLGWDERGYLYPDQTGSVLTGHDYTTDDIVSFAIDIDAGKAFIRKNSDSFLASADPSDGSNPNHTFTAGQPMTPFIASYRSAEYTLNCGQDSTFGGQETATTHADSNGFGQFHTAPPSGYLALCTANLPEPTIGPNSDTQADDHFKTVIYNGSNSAQTITTGLQPDWIWIKVRSLTGYHNITDTSRGITRELYANTTDDEENNGRIESSSTTGFTFPSTEYGYTNENGQTFVSWNWHANGGTATASGSESGNTLAYSAQANTTAGFSIVTYTGNGANNADVTINHGLGVAPDMVIIKNRTNANRWQTWHKDLSADGTYTTKNVLLNVTNAESAYSDQIKSVSSSAVIVRSDDSNGNGNVNKDSSNYVAYCFAEVEGYSRFGKYEGNGDANGSFIYTGFKTAFVMVKNIDAAKHWMMFDTERQYNGQGGQYLFANADYAVGTDSSLSFDFLSNGFKARGTDSNNNTSGQTYIYMAFAEAPFKYANAR